jgi:hypothetical protein
MTAAALSFVISAAFCVVLASRWMQRHRPYEAAWAIGFAMFAVGAAAGLQHQATGQATDLNFKLFYLFGAILNVAWLALGTIYLLGSPRTARGATWILVAFSVVAVIVVGMTPVDLSQPGDTGRIFQASPLPRVLAGIGSGVGALILIGGALWSAWIFLRKRNAGRRALANVVIAAGVIIAGLGGLSAFTGASGVVEWTNFVGVLVIFIGFLLI